MDLLAGPVADIFDKLQEEDRTRPGPSWRERLARKVGEGAVPVERVELNSGQVFYVEQASGPEEPVVVLSKPRRAAEAED